MTRPLALCGALLLGACAGGAQGPLFPTSEHFPDASRAAPSFAPEPDSTPSSAALLESAAGSAQGASAGLQLATTPADAEAARQLVTRFFGAVLLESQTDLFSLLSSRAWVLSEGNRQSAQAVWRARFAQLDYTTLSGRLLTAPQTLRTYTLASAERAKRDGAPVPESGREVVVVAHPSLLWPGKTRLFGEELAFRVRPKPDQPGYEIAEITEDFRLP